MQLPMELHVGGRLMRNYVLFFNWIDDCYHRKILVELEKIRGVIFLLGITKCRGEIF